MITNHPKNSNEPANNNEYGIYIEQDIFNPNYITKPQPSPYYTFIENNVNKKPRTIQLIINNLK